jgi:aminoglycoside/choline kinase family phosphotransferase
MDLAEKKTGLNDQRLEQANNWLQKQGVDIQSGFKSIAGDASFRRYFRLKADHESRVLMDAPPATEDIRPFIDVARRLRSAGLHAPEIYHADQSSGFLLLEDLGDALFRGLLNDSNGDMYFPGLFSLLKDMALEVDAARLPLYDGAMLRQEMDLFPDWYLGRHRNSAPREQFDAMWGSFCDHIIQSALDQPQCFVHRDFHSSNLLKTGNGDIGIIDFQDAVRGPVSYDFISLVWDRYIHWPRTRIEKWMEHYRSALGIEMDAALWQRYCDLMGLQRNIKIVGIFARLYYRDGKNGYLEMIPRFYDYVTGTLGLYPEFSEMLSILEQPECVP